MCPGGGRRGIAPLRPSPVVSVCLEAFHDTVAALGPFLLPLLPLRGCTDRLSITWPRLSFSDGCFAVAFISLRVEMIAIEMIQLKLMALVLGGVL